MKKFIFKAKDWQGKTIKGKVEADEKKQAINTLKKKNIVVIELKEEKENILTEIKNNLSSRISLGQLTNFTGQLSTMVMAGLPLAEALELLKEQLQGKMAIIVGDVLEQIKSGQSLSQGLAKYQSVFGEVYVSSIKAGEEGGALEKVLKRLTETLEKKKELVGKIKGAMIYPSIIVVGMIVVMFIMMIFVVPKMTSLYGEFGAEMPMSTRILMAISGLASKFWWLLPLFVLGAMVAFKSLSKTAVGRERIDQLKLKTPLFGPLQEKLILTEICRTLGMLLNSGVHLVDGLAIVGKASGNAIYSQAVDRIKERVEKGFSLAEAIEENQIFPQIVAQMAATGEETGKLDEILVRLSGYFEAETDQKIKGLTSAIEPFIMIVLGVGVAFLVIAVIMPIYNLTNQF